MIRTAMIESARLGWQVLMVGWAAIACEARGPAPAGSPSPRHEAASEERAAAGASSVAAPGSGGAGTVDDVGPDRIDPRAVVPGEPGSGAGGNAAAPGSGAGGMGGRDTGSGGSSGGGSGGNAGASGRDDDSSSSDEQRYAILFGRATPASREPSSSRAAGE